MPAHIYTKKDGAGRATEVVLDSLPNRPVSEACGNAYENERRSTVRPELVRHNTADSFSCP